MQINTHFNGTVPAGQVLRWFAPSWPQDWHVIWYAVPTSPSAAGAPQLDLTVQSERTSADQITYWLDVKNLSGAQIDFEMRYAILNT